MLTKPTDASNLVF